jgi:hypothetical protein
MQFASRLSLVAFATAAARGLLASTPFAAAIYSALVAGAAFYGIGLLLGDLARRLVEEHARSEFERIISGQKPAG